MKRQSIVLGGVVLGAMLSACSGSTLDEHEPDAKTPATKSLVSNNGEPSPGEKPSALAQGRYLRREALDRDFQAIAKAKEAALSPAEQAAIAPRLDALYAERAKLEDPRETTPTIARSREAKATVRVVISPEKQRAYLAQVPRYDAADPRAVAALEALKERTLAR